MPFFAGPCPQCQTILKRDKFRVQFFEDADMDKEVEIRRKVTQELFLREEDFPSLRAYNDYLEQIEGFIYNLANGVDLDQTRKDMDMMKDSFKKGLLNSRHKKSKDQVLLEELVEKEKASTDIWARHTHDEQVGDGLGIEWILQRCFSLTCRLNDGVTDWLIDGVIDWLIEWLIDWLIDWLIRQMRR